MSPTTPGLRSSQSNVANLKRKKGGLLIKMELMTADYSLRRTGPENGIQGSSWIVESGEKCGLGQ